MGPVVYRNVRTAHITGSLKHTVIISWSCFARGVDHLCSPSCAVVVVELLEFHLNAPEALHL